jgi:hypothetical protein
MRWRGGDNVRVISEEIPFRLMSSKTWVGLHMANITEQEVDLLITGRGIIGTGVAGDANRRGLSVVFLPLCLNPPTSAIETLLFLWNISSPHFSPQ